MLSAKVRLTGQIAVVVLAAASRLAAQEPPQVPPPSPIEQALVERVCVAALEGAHDQCVAAKLVALRADFGRDLSKLSVADRRVLDDACIQVRTLEGRDAYIGCLDGQLTKIRARMTKSKAPAAAAATTAFTPSSAPGEEPAPAGSSASSMMTIVGGTAAGMFVAAGIAFHFMRSRRIQKPSNCGRCGAEMPESGSLCVTCRREAAEEIRRASAERAQQERAQDDFARREREELEVREQQARLEEAERLRQEELTRQYEEEERLRQEEEARRPLVEETQTPAVVVEEPAGPWAVLGVTKDAGPDEIYAAYQEAKAKYDPDFVSHLGSDAQEHFKNKALAIDAAYQQVMAALTSAA